MIWDKYKGVFNIFNNITVTIVRKGNFDDYENKYDLEEIGTVTGDIQPYSGDLSEHDYGLRIECQKKLYCASTFISDARYGLKLDNGAVLELEMPLVGGGIQEALYAVADKQSFKIVYVAEYAMGLAVLLKEVDLNGGCE